MPSPINMMEKIKKLAKQMKCHSCLQIKKNQHPFFHITFAVPFIITEDEKNKTYLKGWESDIQIYANMMILFSKYAKHKKKIVKGLLS